jgi:hypothetical protein
MQIHLQTILFAMNFHGMVMALPRVCISTKTKIPKTLKYMLVLFGILIGRSKNALDQR